MTQLEIRMPMFPPCWDSCGNCVQGEVYVAEVLALPGQALAVDQTVIVLETGKVALDIPSPHAGVVAEVRVKVGDRLQPGQLLCTLDGEPARGPA